MNEEASADAIGFVRESGGFDRGELTWHAAGSGDPVICFHPAAGLQIRAVARHLATSFRVYCPVVPGYEGTPYVPGLATVPDVADLIGEFIQRKIGGPVKVVGHSMGSRLGAWLTILHPNLVQRLVLMAPAGFRPVGAPTLSFEPAEFLRQLYARPERRAPETRTPEQLAANRRAMAHYGIGAPRDEDLVRRIGEIHCPTLVVGGEKDVRVPAEAIRDVHARIKVSKIAYIEDAAHSIESDQPEAAAALVGNFLRQD